MKNIRVERQDPARPPLKRVVIEAERTGMPQRNVRLEVVPNEPHNVDVVVALDSGDFDSTRVSRVPISTLEDAIRIFRAG